MKKYTAWKACLSPEITDPTEEEIKEAKALYRKLYKANWKKEKAQLRKELRPWFTLRELQIIVRKAQEENLKPTVFARNIILGTITDSPAIPSKETLQNVLQLVMVSATMHPSPELLKAELLLHSYLQ